MKNNLIAIRENIKIKITYIEKYFTIFFYGLSIFILCLMVQGTILTLANIFFLPLILLSSAIALIVALFCLKKTRKDIKVLPTISFPMILFTTIVLSIIIFLPHDSFGGGDESVYSNMAVHLAQNGTLNLPKYLNYLPDHYAEAARSRLPVYTVWLAIQQIFFGDRWLLRSNVILVGLGLFALFIISSLIAGKKNGLITLALFSTSMPLLWFSRETLSEVLSLFLLWILILFFITFLKTKRYLFFLVSLTAVWLFALCRIEGFFIQFSVILAYLFVLFINKTKNIKKHIFVIFIYLIIISSNILIIKYFSLSSYFAGVNSSISSLVKDAYSLPINSISNDLKLSDKITLFIFNMLAKYNYILVFASIFLICSLISIHKNKNSNLAKKYFFVTLIILLPEFFKFINPGVSLSQPGMYRRYMYALLPFGYICLVIFIQNITNKKRLISLFIFSLFLVINLCLSYNIIFLKNNWLLVDKLKQISKDVSKDDLIVVRSLAIEPYYAYSFFILRKYVRTVAESQLTPSNFFPNKKIFNGTPYKKIYLFTTKDEEEYKSFKIKKISTVETRYTQIQHSCLLYLLGEDLRLRDTYSWSSFPYIDAVKYCSRSEYEIKKYKEQLFLYELLQ